MLFYRAALPLSAQTLSYVAGVIRRHRAAIGSSWRKLNPGRQALLALVHLRKGEGFADLVEGFAVGTATAWRYVARPSHCWPAAPPSCAVRWRRRRRPGTRSWSSTAHSSRSDKVAEDRPFYSGKHRRHGMNLQVISSPSGQILWVSGPLPGATHDLTAARIWDIIRELADAGLIVLADKAYIGAGEHVLTRHRGRNKPASQKPPTPPTRNCAPPASEPTPSSRPGASCANSASAPAASARSPSDSRPLGPRDRRMKTFNVGADRAGFRRRRISHGVRR